VSETQKLKEWRLAVSELRGQCSELLGMREIFQRVRDIVHANPALKGPNAFLDFFGETYSFTAAFSVKCK
jgi:hypothetical protein